MSVVTVKQRDTAQVFTDSLTQDGLALDLTDATVLFLLRHEDTGEEFSDDAVIEGDPQNGDVSFGPGVLPTTPGVWKQEWEVTLVDDTVLTFPNDGYNDVIIRPDLNPPVET
jgi:hypothetical protein